MDRIQTSIEYAEHIELIGNWFNAFSLSIITKIVAITEGTMNLQKLMCFAICNSNQNRWRWHSFHQPLIELSDMNSNFMKCAPRTDYPVKLHFQPKEVIKILLNLKWIDWCIGPACQLNQFCKSHRTIAATFLAIQNTCTFHVNFNFLFSFHHVFNLSYVCEVLT